MSYIISCESTCDLGKNYLDSNNIKFINYNFTVDGKTYLENDENYTLEKFYSDLSNGSNATTSLINQAQYYDYFKELVKEKDVLHIGFSSNLSGSFRCAYLAAQEINEESDNKVYVYDSLGASQAFGILVIKALENKNNGCSIDENILKLDQIRNHIHAFFYPTDLSFLVKGGRISKTAGLIGNALKICPLLILSNEGKIETLDKVRTRVKCNEKICEYIEEVCGKDYDKDLYVVHSVFEQGANDVINTIKSKFKNIKNVTIGSIGTVLGVHTGPGAIAVFVVGNKQRLK